MSANPESVRSIYADWERGNFSWADWADPEIEFVTVDGPEPGRWTGLNGMAEGWRGWLSGWTDFRAEPDEYLVLDDDRTPATDLLQPATEEEDGLAEGETELIFISPRRRPDQNEAGR